MEQLTFFTLHPVVCRWLNNWPQYRASLSFAFHPVVCRWLNNWLQYRASIPFVSRVKCKPPFSSTLLERQTAVMATCWRSQAGTCLQVWWLFPFFIFWSFVRFNCAPNSAGDYWQPFIGLKWLPRALSLITILAWACGCIIFINEFPIGPLSHACSLSRSGLAPSRAEVGLALAL